MRDIRKMITLVDIEEIKKPKEGYIVYMNRWWALLDNKVILYRKNIPQCNPSKEIVKMISKKLYSGDIIFIELAYIPYS